MRSHRREQPPGRQRFAFICGCGHSGTTLLATILSENRAVYVPLVETRAFLRSPLRRWLRLARLRFRAWRAGKSVIVEKTPRHVHRIDAIRATMPGTHIVVMTRDGRDVAASIGARTGGQFAAGIERWIRDNKAAALARGRPDVLLVRYEDLVESPAATVRRVCAFIGVEFDEAMLDYYKRPRQWFQPTGPRAWFGRSHQTSLHARRNAQINQPIFDGRGRWVSDLPPAYWPVFTTGDASELMRTFGYLDETASARASSSRT